MQHTFTVVIATLILLVSGCAGVAEKRSAIASQPPTVGAFADMEFVPIPFEQARDISLDDPKRIFAFPEGNGHFAALELPAADTSRAITFRSYSEGSLMSSKSVLIPKVTFLDGTRQPLGTQSPAQIRTGREMFHGTFYHGRVPVPASATYAVLHPAEAVEPPLVARSANGTPWPVALSPVGKTSISVTTIAVATIEDSGFAEDGSKAQFFVVDAVDGKDVPNSLGETAAASVGTGLGQNAVFVGREIPAKPSKLTLRGTHRTGAPIHEIASRAAGTFFSVEGDVQFTPAAGGRYVVKGELRKEGSSVWLENAVTGEVVTEKVQSK